MTIIILIVKMRSNKLLQKIFIYSLLLNSSLTANNTSFYFDYHDGEYGYNTSASRGADTFVPFKSDEVSPEVVTKIVNAVYNADKVTNSHSEANVTNSTASCIVPISYTDDDEYMYILSSISTSCYAAHEAWIDIGGGTRCLYANASAYTTLYALNADKASLGQIFSGGANSGNTTWTVTCSLFETTIPDNTEYIKITNTAVQGYDSDAYDSLSANGSVSGTTATYLKLDIE